MTGMQGLTVHGQRYITHLCPCNLLLIIDISTQKDSGAYHQGINSKHLEDNKASRNSLHRFVESKSWLTNLVSFCDKFMGFVDGEKAMDMIYLSFSMAFDIVFHGVLISNIRQYSLDETTVR